MIVDLPAASSPGPFKPKRAPPMVLAIAAVVSTSPPVTMAVEPFSSAVGESAEAAAVADEYARAQKSFDSNPVRKARALSISGKP